MDHYLDTSRLDVVDLTEAEIKQLVDATKNATCANDLVAVAEVIGRLRLDGSIGHGDLQGARAPPRDSAAAAAIGLAGLSLHAESSRR